MSKRMSILLVVLTIVSGLIGGAISGRIFAPKVAIAEETTQSKVLTVEELRIVDKYGNLLIKLGKDDELPFLLHGVFFYTQDGKIGAGVGVSEYGGSVMVKGKDNKGASMSASNEDGFSVTVFGKDIKSGVMMSALKDRGAVTVFGRVGENNKVLVDMGIYEYGGGITVSGKADGNLKARIGVNEYGYGVIGRWDKNGYGED